MRAVIQRVNRASVVVDGEVVGSCPKGLCLLLAVHRDDDLSKVKKMSEKLLNLRIFGDADGKMNLSLLDLKGQNIDCGVLAVSNFTVYGDTTKSRRPSFTESAGFDRGLELFDALLSELRLSGLPVGSGVFGADMEVTIVNDGPVTLVVEI